MRVFDRFAGKLLANPRIREAYRDSIERRAAFYALMQAAADWDDDSEQSQLRHKKLAEEQYRAGGPSMPTNWLRQRAYRIRNGGEW